jgi:pimeloyl-ACP methyl ester carboxylesterase
MSLLAHSYGTLIASALTKLAASSPSAPSVSSLTLVDPVW